MRPRWCAPSLLAASLFAASASAQPGPPGPAGLLPEVMARLAQAPERRATFEEEKRLAVLDRPLRSTGTLLYRRPRHLERHTIYPAPESLVVDGDRLVLTVGQEPLERSHRREGRIVRRFHGVETEAQLAIPLGDHGREEIV